MVMAVQQAEAVDKAAAVSILKDTKGRLDAARPTAVNLMWATQRMVEIGEALAANDSVDIASYPALLEGEARHLADEDVRMNKRLAVAGAAVVPHGANLLHHCNTGALATVDIGTALGIIYECHAQGKGIHVWVDETRPRLQGSRLTAWELMRAGVPMHLVADNAAGLLMQRGKVDAVVFGADRVAANGDVVNKIGTYKLAVVAREHGIPVYAAVPTPTIDLEMESGEGIPIEERGADEVRTMRGVPTAPADVPVFNPAFDMTPSKFLTGIVTEEGICYPPFAVSLREAKQHAEARAKAAWEARLALLSS
jgi:methylthioribose-1-phosphate isomerase